MSSSIVTRSPVHPFTRSPVHPFTRSPAHPFTLSSCHDTAGKLEIGTILRNKPVRTRYDMDRIGVLHILGVRLCHCVNQVITLFLSKLSVLHEQPSPNRTQLCVCMT